MVSALEPRLDVEDIQGNILAGFNKDLQVLVFLSIDQKAGAKAWLRRIVDFVSPTSDVLRFNRLFRAVRKRSRRPSSVAAAWMNLAFSHAGIAKLSSSADADLLPDDAFRIGMPERAVSILGDPAEPNAPGHPSQWVVGAPGHVPDIVLIVAGDRKSMVDDLLAQVLPTDTEKSALTVMRTEVGTARTDLPGHEHFGFKDGISQPGVRGIVSANETDFLTPRLFDDKDPLSASQARPGQPLIMPGQFVLGYDSQSARDGSTVPAPPLARAWFRNGSFLVFRRLRQDVWGFRAFLNDAAAKLAKIPGQSGMTAERLGALLVGRWPNGAPIVRSPDAPHGAFAADLAANAFAFSNATPEFALKPGVPADAAPPAPADPLALVCPHWAHIRKVNPRDDVTDLGDEFDTLGRRLLRRGIAYGAPLPESATKDDAVDRGLLFLAYHSSLEQSFEEVTADWTNSRLNPSPDGFDLIIGQNNRDKRRRTAKLGNIEIEAPRDFVTATGGGYFFAPSLSAIGVLAARP